VNAKGQISFNEGAFNSSKTDQNSEVLRCHIEQVSFRNEDTLYTVLKVRDIETNHLFSAVGEFATCEKGDEFELEGYWYEHPKYGYQFNVVKAIPIPPSTAEGIERLLGSGIIPKIGKKFAKKIVRKFGADTINVILNNPQELKKIKGLGKERIEKLHKYFSEKSQEREAMLFLYSHGITPGFATKIISNLGVEAPEIIKQNPFILSELIDGIGFKTADKLAMNLGVDHRSYERIRAGILHVLSEAESDGHCFLFGKEIIEKATPLLSVESKDIESVAQSMVKGGELISTTLKNEKETINFLEHCIYTPSLYRAEVECARYLQALLSTQPETNEEVDKEVEIENVEKELGIKFASAQREAIIKSFEKKVSAITGGPGTGKTTIIKAIVYLFQKWNQEIYLCAPTGRAAKRLSEATGKEAKTIHRLLRWNPISKSFEHNERNTLPTQMLIVDETSMVDVRLMLALLRALDPKTRLLFVGDADQLPSVGPGNVLGDMLSSGIIPFTRLDEIFRQARTSMIVSNAHRINKGLMPLLQPEPGQLQDFFFIERNEPQSIAETIIEMVATRIPKKFNFDPIKQIQVLAPMHKGVIGVSELNERLSKILNPNQDEGIFAGKFRAGDKVIQTKNNYDLEVFNGDIGIVVNIDSSKKSLTVDFDGKLVTYKRETSEELAKAFAISIHKSQGSEYEAVVAPVSTSNFVMLQRNLIYTAVTRAKKLVVLIGTKKALAIALKNAGGSLRNTMLSVFLTKPI